MDEIIATFTLYVYYNTQSISSKSSTHVELLINLDLIGARSVSTIALHKEIVCGSPGTVRTVASFTSVKAWRSAHLKSSRT